jgi:hypothetical protein
MQVMTAWMGQIWVISVPPRFTTRAFFGLLWPATYASKGAPVARWSRRPTPHQLQMTRFGGPRLPCGFTWAESCGTCDSPERAARPGKVTTARRALTAYGREARSLRLSGDKGALTGSLLALIRRLVGHGRPEQLLKLRDLLADESG